MGAKTSDRVLILDFGSQYTQLIARRIRELGVFSEIRPYTISLDRRSLEGVRAIILSGGPASTTEPGAPTIDPDWFDLGLPVLGICYGMQLMARLLGGEVGRGSCREYGQAMLKIERPDGLFNGLAESELQVWMSHGDHVDRLPAGFEVVAGTSATKIAAMSNPSRNLYGIQFHPEVAHTPKGNIILSNFVFSVAGCSGSWSAAAFVDSARRDIEAALPASSRVICGLSGGVDSAVAAVLVHRAIGDRLTCLFVDNGLLRADEADEIVALFGRGGLGLNFIRVDAQEIFLERLAGVIDPEEKRKIIGRTFIEVFESQAAKITGVTHLVQGTLYPDVIESVSVRGPSATIKTHHNVGGLPEKMNLKLIEPLRELFKDEVRKIGLELGMPREILFRQPFPGPGLAVRILGEVTAARLEILRSADRIFNQEIVAGGFYEKLWQSFAVLLPVQSVGVMGDERTYELTIALRAVTSDDGMTADWCYLPEGLLRSASHRIINQVKGVNRVVLDLSTKPPATIEWE